MHSLFIESSIHSVKQSIFSTYEELDSSYGDATTSYLLMHVAQLHHLQQQLDMTGYWSKQQQHVQMSMQKIISNLHRCSTRCTLNLFNASVQGVGKGA